LTDGKWLHRCRIFALIDVRILVIGLAIASCSACEPEAKQFSFPTGAATRLAAGWWLPPILPDDARDVQVYVDFDNGGTCVAWNFDGSGAAIESALLAHHAQVTPAPSDVRCPTYPWWPPDAFGNASQRYVVVEHVGSAEHQGLVYYAIDVPRTRVYVYRASRPTGG
jgi:hypothetical protein